MTLSRFSAFMSSGSVDTDFSKDCVAVHLVISFAAVASDVAENRVAALWSIFRELRIRLVGAGSSLDAHIAGGGDTTGVAGAADESRGAVAIGLALRSSGAGREGHGGSYDGRPDETANHFGSVLIHLWL